MYAFTIALLVLCTWRVAHLITDDEIPFGRLRDYLERRFPNYGYGLGCTFCMSIWTGAASAAAAVWWLDLLTWEQGILWWGAVASTTILIEAAVSRLVGD